MGLLANIPVGLAPGLGLNAYVRLQYLQSDFAYDLYPSLRTRSLDFMVRVL